MPIDVQLQETILMVKFLKLGFIVAGALFILFAFTIPARTKTTPAPVVELAISILVLTCAVAGFFFPRLLLLKPHGLPSDPASTPAQLWFTQCVFSLAFFDACNLFAVALHFLGGRAQIVELFFCDWHALDRLLESRYSAKLRSRADRSMLNGAGSISRRAVHCSKSSRRCASKIGLASRQSAFKVIS